MAHRMPNGVKNLQAFEAGGKKYIRLDGYGCFEFQNVSLCVIFCRFINGILFCDESYLNVV